MIDPYSLLSGTGDTIKSSLWRGGKDSTRVSTAAVARTVARRNIRKENSNAEGRVMRQRAPAIITTITAEQLLGTGMSEGRGGGGIKH